MINPGKSNCAREIPISSGRRLTTAGVEPPGMTFRDRRLRARNVLAAWCGRIPSIDVWLVVGEKPL